MNRAFARFATMRPYLIWLLVSLVLLLGTRPIDPYLFGFATFVCGGISAIMLLIAVFHGPRAAASALLAAVPTALAYWLLSTYRWA